MCATRSTIRAWIAAVVLSLGLIAPAAAGPVENAMAPYWRGDYATAMRLLRPIADEGNADAQLRLGHMYASGQGVPQDDATAVTWFRKATDQGNAAAQTYLGLMYVSGQGVSQDYAMAVTWVRKAADQGYAPAQGRLGLMYLNGLGVAQD